MGRLGALLLGLSLPVLASGQVNTLPSAPHLLVKGHAAARVVPDRFRVHLNVDVTDMSPDIARQKVEAHVHQLLKALDVHGALPAQTHASSLSIEPQTGYENGKSVFKGTGVSRSIDATFDNLDKLRAFIAAVPADKEVQIGSLSTGRSDADAIALRLRSAAIENSKMAAGKIAAAYGMKLIGVYAVSDVAPDFAYGVQAGSWGNASELSVTGARGGPPTPAPPPPASMSPKVLPPELRAGTQTLQQDIYVVYLIAPK